MPTPASAPMTHRNPYGRNRRHRARSLRRAPWRTRGACIALSMLWASMSYAQFSSCKQIPDPAARLACYDELARTEPGSDARTPLAPQATSDAGSPAGNATMLEQRWELRPELKRGILNLVPHRPVYGLVHWTSDANDQPFSPTRAFGPVQDIELDRAEGKFQLSFKTKVMESVLGSPGDLWFGYTQVSYWQVGNSRYSSPFRETNYEPEATFVYPLQIGTGDLRLRFASITLNHQSNGRSGSLSRSWNRLIGEAAAEYGPWSFHVRPWTRVLARGGERDDNPDIEDFVGRGELKVVRRAGGHVLSLTGRHSLKSGSRSHGGAQFDWAFPIAGSMNGHVQVFTGYGQNLIDYNHRQTTVGVGVSFFD